MAEMEMFEAKTSQVKRMHQHKHPVSKGARNIAVSQESGLRPACWKAKTTRTEAAMRSKEPGKSSCLQERRAGCFIILSIGQVNKNSTTAITATGPLWNVSNTVHLIIHNRTHLIQNTHLQLVNLVITPPTTGPMTPATATTSPTTAPIHFLFSSLTISGRIIIVNEYSPLPPTPCTALNPTNCHKVFANPHASEKVKNIVKASNQAARRPITSLRLAKGTAKLR
jgi:hypothetical protein